MQYVRRLAVAAIAIALCPTSPLAQSSPVKLDATAPAPANLDFEAGEPGKAPPGWASTTAGFPAVVSADRPRDGKQCAVARAGKDSAGFGILMQAVDATPLRGHRVRLSAALRAEGAPARLWLRVDRAGGLTGFFENMQNRPVTSDAWQAVEIVADVEEDAEAISFGLLVVGTSGAAAIDAVALADVGKVTVIAEPARPLDDRGLQNVAAFARLLGYVRHFHPSDEAAATDWSLFAIEGVRRVESAASPEDLARRLADLFAPVAPSVVVVPKGTAIGRLDAPPPAGGSVVAWHHKGFGTGDAEGIYRSERRRAPLEGNAVPAGFHDPRRPLARDLPGGVTAHVPLALFADASGTLPRATAKRAGAPPLVRLTADDRATRLADVALAWNVFQHFYPYFDVTPTKWEPVLDETLRAAAVDANAEAFTITMRRMIAALADGHGSVYGPGPSQDAALPVVWSWIEGQLVVTGVAAEGAEGLAPGDVVERVDGRPAREAVEAAERLVSASTPQWGRYIALDDLRSGPERSTVALEVRTPAGARRTVTLARSGAHLTLLERRPEKVAELEPGVFYVDLDRISDADFEAALPKLEAARGIVFDMRGYPNGLSTKPLRHITGEPLQSARWMVPVVTSPDHEGPVEWNTDGRWMLEPAAPRLKAKLAFVVDGRAISYAESWMGIVEAYKLAQIVGEPTAGTNGNINPFTLPGGYTIRWTGMKVLKHDGSRHHGVGILPTVPVSRTLRGVAEGRDEQLERAAAIVAGRT